MRRILSGVASALFIARRIQAGLAANIRPSSTNRTPTPMRKSANAMDLIGLEPPVCDCVWLWHPGRSDVRFGPLKFGSGLRRRRRSGRGRHTRRTVEEPEEIRVRPQQEAGIVTLQSVLIGRHRTIEREEVRILAIGFGEQPVALAVAVAACLFGLRVGFGDDHGGFAVGVGPDLLRLLSALGAEFGGFALPLGLHALIDCL